MRAAASLVAAALSPASATAAELARALLAFRRSAAAPILAAALHHRVHGDETPRGCRECSDPAPLLMAVAAGAVAEETIDERMVEDSYNVYIFTSRRSRPFVRREIIFRSAAVLFLAGCPDKAAHLAVIGHDESPEHSWLWCPTCDSPPEGSQPDDRR